MRRPRRGVSEAITIEPISADDVPLLVRHLPRPRAKHVERLERQRRGELVYLIAWRDSTPVGHALLKSPGAVDLAPGRRERCSEVEDLFVAAEHRRRGVGSDLMEAAEREARRQRFAKVGLAVGVANAAARRLYERRGYADTGYGEFVLFGSVLGDDGTRHAWEETCIYLVKHLPDV